MYCDVCGYMESEGLTNILTHECTVGQQSLGIPIRVFEIQREKTF